MGATGGILCGSPILMMRTVALPESAEFHFGAVAFDSAVADHEKGRDLDAAHGFISATIHFGKAGAAGNWKYSYQNAALCFGIADRIDEGKRAFEDLAQHDPPHAQELRAEAATITSWNKCK